jgi:hypothetical protein
MKVLYSQMFGHSSRAVLSAIFEVEDRIFLLFEIFLRKIVEKLYFKFKNIISVLENIQVILRYLHTCI